MDCLSCAIGQYDDDANAASTCADCEQGMIHTCLVSTALSQCPRTDVLTHWCFLQANIKAKLDKRLARSARQVGPPRQLCALETSTNAILSADAMVLNQARIKTSVGAHHVSFAHKGHGSLRQEQVLRQVAHCA